MILNKLIMNNNEQDSLKLRLDLRKRKDKKRAHKQTKEKTEFWGYIMIYY